MDRTRIQKVALATQAGFLITAFSLLVELRFWEFDIDYGKYLLAFGFAWLWFYFVVPSAGGWLKKRPPSPPS